MVQLKDELKKAKEKNVELQEESRMHRNRLAKKIYEVEGLLYETRKSLRRGFPLSLHVLNLYCQNKTLQARNKVLKERLHLKERKNDRRGLDLLAQEALG